MLASAQPRQFCRLLLLHPNTRTTLFDLSDHILFRFEFQEEIAEFAKELVANVGTKRWIANLGHGMYPDHNPEHLGAFIDAIHKYSQQPTDDL